MALIDVPTLADQLTRADAPTVIDVSWRLGGPTGRLSYLAGHIPGARFLDLDTQLCGRPGPAGRHPLPEPADLEQALRAAGVREGHPVVAYDAGDGQAAARLWWTLRWAGHAEVSILDGGFAAWTAQGRPVEPGDPSQAGDTPRPDDTQGPDDTRGPGGTQRPGDTQRPGNVVVRPGHLPVLDAAGATALARDGVLLDARVEPRYRGQTEPIDPVAGRVPGARNLPAARLAGPDGRLRPPAELREIFAAAGVGAGTGDGTRPVGAYCGSGVTAAQTVFALHQAGFDDAALYVGSWSNWVADPTRPVATGPLQ